MKEIKLYNRDGANLKLVKINNENPGQWKLTVDKKHNYILRHMRIIGKEYVHDMNNPDNWEAIDPSGGPFINIGLKFDNKYKVIGFVDSLTLIISENEDNNN